MIAADEYIDVFRLADPLSANREVWEYGRRPGDTGGARPMGYHGGEQLLMGNL